MLALLPSGFTLNFNVFVVIVIGGLVDEYAAVSPGNEWTGSQQVLDQAAPGVPEADADLVN